MQVDCQYLTDYYLVLHASNLTNPGILHKLLINLQFMMRSLKQNFLSFILRSNIWIFQVKIQFRNNKMYFQQIKS